MLKKLNFILNIVIGAAVGNFIGNSLYVFWEYKRYPELYVMQSAPWYTGILLFGIVTAFVLAAAVLIKLIIRKKIRE